MKTPSASTRRPGLLPGFLKLAAATAAFASLSALATPTFEFYDSQRLAEAVITFESNGQLLISLINTGTQPSGSWDEVLAGLEITLPGAGAHTPGITTFSPTGGVLPGSKSLAESWAASFAQYQYGAPGIPADIGIFLKAKSKAGVASAGTTSVPAFVNGSFSLAEGQVDFTFTLEGGSLAPDDFRRDGVTVAFLFGKNSSSPAKVVAGHPGLLDLPPAPAPAAIPIPEPSPLPLIATALTLALIARKRF